MRHSRVIASSSAQRVSDYLAERFAPRLVVVFLITYATAILYGKAVVAGGALHVSLGDLAGALGFVAFLMVVRVYDEHKDFAFDSAHLPDRPLPRGAISWRAVNGLGYAAALVQIVVCVALDGGIGPVSVWWLIAFAYLGMSRFWFFRPRWFKRHFVTNTIVHVPIYALATVWAAQIGARPASLPVAAVWLGLFMYTHTFVMDLWRKSHAPEDERPGVDSYTKRWGTTGAAVATAIVVLIGGVFASAMLAAVDSGTPIAYVAMGAITLPMLAALAGFARKPDRHTNMRKSNLVMLALVAQELIVIVTLCLERGVG